MEVSVTEPCDVIRVDSHGIVFDKFHKIWQDLKPVRTVNVNQLYTWVYDTLNQWCRFNVVNPLAFEPFNS